MKTLLMATLALALLAAAPNGTLASSFIGSGGGSGSFSSIRAFDRMIGGDAVLRAERDLTTTYGHGQAGRFINEFDFAVHDAWNVAGRDDVKLPNAPASSGSPALAQQLVRSGTAADGTFDMNDLFSNLFTPQVQAQVMRDLDARYGSGSSAAFTRMGDRFFSDVASDVNVSLQPPAH